MRDAVFTILVIVIILGVLGGGVIYVASLPPRQLAQLDQWVANIISLGHG